MGITGPGAPHVFEFQRRGELPGASKGTLLLGNECRPCVDTCSQKIQLLYLQATTKKLLRVGVMSDAICKTGQINPTV